MKCVCSGSVPYSYKELPDGRGRPGASGGSIESPVGGKRRSWKGPSGQPLAAHRTPHRRRWESENHRCGDPFSFAATLPPESIDLKCPGGHRAGSAVPIQGGREDDALTPRPGRLSHQVGAGGVPNVYGHITLKTPVLVRSLKLSNVEPS